MIFYFFKFHGVEWHISIKKFENNDFSVFYILGIFCETRIQKIVFILCSDLLSLIKE